jgi:hypothetical protein
MFEKSGTERGADEIRAFSVGRGSRVGVQMATSLWYADFNVRK